jgi:hypothetical protein
MVVPTHRCHTAGGDVETSCDDNDVKFINCAVLQLDAFGGEARNGVVLDIDDVYIGLVELLVVAVFEAGALDAKGVRWL